MIFFDHIKGCSKDTTAYDKGLWTWIQFAKSKNDGFPDSPYPKIIVAKGSNGINKIIDNTTTQNYLLNPEQFSGADNWSAEGNTVKTLGDIITTFGPKQEIHKDITFYWTNTLYVNSIHFSDDVSFFAGPSQDFKVYKDNSLTYFTLNATSGVKVKTNTAFEKDVKCDGQIQAVSFNATSDKRAKTNIKRLDQEKALDIVNKLPVYSFNYKKDNIPSIGVLAQEAAVYDGAIPNFSLVNNEQATGENGDYQTVKESKLVYILWAAIQEQSRQINQLKSQLKELQK